MPIFSSLGALAYTKVFLGDNYYWYIETEPSANSGGTSIPNQFSTAVVNNNIVYIGGNISSSANISVTNPWFLKVSDDNFSLPTNPYQAFYANVINPRPGQVIDMTYSANNEIYFTGLQTILNAGVNHPAAVTRITDTNGNIIASYADLSTGNSRSRTSTSVETHANGTYTISGQSEETAANFAPYITNFSGNVKNWAKVFNAPSLTCNLRKSKYDTNIVSVGANIAELDSSGNSLSWQYNTGASIIDFDTDTSNNIYFTQGNTLVKIDNTGNIIWQQQISSNLSSTSGAQIDSLQVVDGNVFVAGQANGIGGNTARLPMALMSFDSNTGNINWQRQFRENSIFFTTSSTSLVCDSNDLYVSATQTLLTDYGFMIKVPASGAIPGNGNYSNSLIYTSMNVAISNANISITTGNLVLSNAVSTAVITTVPGPNTTLLYTFNSTRFI
jgi:hypothetical protein